MKQIRSVIGIIICIIMLVLLTITLSKQNLKNLFVKEKLVNNIVDFNECTQGDFVKVKVTKAYETQHNLQNEQGKDVAKYIDVELNGYALIAIVENSIAQEVLKDEEKEIYITGKLQNLENTDMSEGLTKIKENYLEDLGKDMSEEEILNIFTKLQLVNYGEEKPNILIVVALMIAIIIVLIGMVLLIRITINNKKKNNKKENKESKFKNV